MNNILKEHKCILEGKLSFTAHFDLTNGSEVRESCSDGKGQTYHKMIWRKARYKHMIVQLGHRGDEAGSCCLKIRGSIHKFSRDGDNSGPFTATEARIAIDKLCQELQLDKADAKITALEIGFNVPLDYEVYPYLKSNILRHKLSPFERMEREAGNIGWEAVNTNYRAKLYAKAPKTLRWEIHWSDMEELRQEYSLHTLKDLTEALIIKIAEERVIAEWSNVAMSGGIRIVKGYFPDGISTVNKEILKNYCSPKFLNDLNELITKEKESGNDRAYNKLRQMRLRGRKSFDLLIHRYGDKKHESILAAMLDSLNRSKIGGRKLKPIVKLPFVTYSQSGSHKGIREAAQIKL